MAERGSEKVLTGTCQICGREVKCSSGVIAHHGYKRPEGWHAQTASCAGARYEAYEVSRERIPAVISAVERYLAARLAYEAVLKAYPEKVYGTRSVRKNAWERVEERFEVARPEGFVLRENAYYSHESYGAILSSNLRTTGYEIRNAREEVERLKARYEGWKPGSVEETTRVAEEREARKGVREALTSCGECGLPLTLLRDARKGLCAKHERERSELRYLVGGWNYFKEPWSANHAATHETRPDLLPPPAEEAEARARYAVLVAKGKANKVKG